MLLSAAVAAGCGSATSLSGDDGTDVPPDAADGDADDATETDAEDGTGDEGSETCTATCGDGIVQGGIGESCDDGNTTTAGDGCGPSCRFETVGASCGDGLVDPLEVCDDGNLLNGDACNPTCNLGSCARRAGNRKQSIRWRPLAVPD
jgi:cysteine-rich repeat protein